MVEGLFHALQMWAGSISMLRHDQSGGFVPWHSIQLDLSRHCSAVRVVPLRRSSRPADKVALGRKRAGKKN